MLRLWIRSASVVIGFWMVLLMLLIAAHAVPDDHLADRLVEARVEGDYYQFDGERVGSAYLLDSFSDCFGAAIGLGADGAVESALRSPTLGNCALSNPALDHYVETGELISNWDYFRYWHGYAVITRPAIALVGLGATRVLLTVAISVATLAVALLATRRIGSPAGALILAPLVLTTDLLRMSTALPTAVGVVCALLGPTLVFLGPPISPTSDPVGDHRLMRRIMVAGGLVSFTDLFSVGPISWTLTVTATVLLLSDIDCRNRRSVRMTAAATAAWMFGYATTWAAKWFFTIFEVGWDNVWTAVSDRVLFRIDGEHRAVQSGPFRTTLENAAWWLDQPLTPVVLVATAGIVVFSAYRRTAWRDWLARFAMAAAPAALVPLWYETLRNHSQIHRWLTYRFLPTAAGIVIIAALVAGPLERAREPRGAASPTRQDSMP